MNDCDARKRAQTALIRKQEDNDLDQFKLARLTTIVTTTAPPTAAAKLARPTILPRAASLDDTNLKVKRQKIARTTCPPSLIETDIKKSISDCDLGEKKHFSSADALASLTSYGHSDSDSE